MKSSTYNDKLSFIKKGRFIQSTAAIACQYEMYIEMTCNKKNRPSPTKVRKMTTYI